MVWTVQNVIDSKDQMKIKVLLEYSGALLRGGITLIVHFLGAKEQENSKGGE